MTSRANSLGSEIGSLYATSRPLFPSSVIFIGVLLVAIGTLITPPFRVRVPAALLKETNTLEVEVSKEQSLNEVFSRLSALGIGVLSMRNKVNRLEELFMKLVERPDVVRGEAPGVRPA